MPAGVVRTKAQEEDWQEAKEIVSKQKKKPKKKWGLVMHIFKQKQKGKKKSAAYSLGVAAGMGKTAQRYDPELAMPNEEVEQRRRKFLHDMYKRMGKLYHGAEAIHPDRGFHIFGLRMPWTGQTLGRQALGRNPRQYLKDMATWRARRPRTGIPIPPTPAGFAYEAQPRYASSGL